MEVRDPFNWCNDSDVQDAYLDTVLAEFNDSDTEVTGTISNCDVLDSSGGVIHDYRRLAGETVSQSYEVDLLGVPGRVLALIDSARQSLTDTVQFATALEAAVLSATGESSGVVASGVTAVPLQKITEAPTNSPTVSPTAAPTEMVDRLAIGFHTFSTANLSGWCGDLEYQEMYETTVLAAFDGDVSMREMVCEVVSSLGLCKQSYVVQIYGESNYVTDLIAAAAAILEDEAGMEAALEEGSGLELDEFVSSAVDTGTLTPTMSPTFAPTVLPTASLSIEVAGGHSFQPEDPFDWCNNSEMQDVYMQTVQAQLTNDGANCTVTITNCDVMGNGTGILFDFRRLAGESITQSFSAVVFGVPEVVDSTVDAGLLVLGNATLFAPQLDAAAAAVGSSVNLDTVIADPAVIVTQAPTEAPTTVPPTPAPTNAPAPVEQDSSSAFSLLRPSLYVATSAWSLRRSLRQA